MAWVSGVDKTPGYLVTAADWNNYLGADADKGVNYLKTEMDKVGDCSFVDQTASRAFYDGTGATDYTNGSKIRLALVTVDHQLYALDGELNNSAYGTPATDSGTAPTYAVGFVGWVSCNLSGLLGEIQRLRAYNPVLMAMLPGEDYWVDDTKLGDGGLWLQDWMEWDLN
uniref:Uncharacterized protein n=1 Tax=viral metagenome TaxID=1070528 RepID=A0A6M3IY76_9ZZZZ